MTFLEEGYLLRILIGENIQPKGRPLWELSILPNRLAQK